jgi:hypothetical protein
MKTINNCLFLLLLVGIMSCGKKSLSPAAYQQYMETEDNGFRKNIVTGDWQFQVQYRPAEMILSKEATSLKDNAAIEQRKKQLEGTAWFNITIKHRNSQQSPLKYNVAGLDEYNSRMNYFLNEAAKDLTLQYGNEVLHPMSYWFETNYNLTPDETMVVAFTLPGNAKKPEKDMVLSYYDRVFTNGIIKATFPASLVKNTPELKL